jgi:hypothetical protein
MRVGRDAGKTETDSPEGNDKRKARATAEQSRSGSFTSFGDCLRLLKGVNSRFPGGNDRKKSKGNNKRRSFNSFRMTNEM